MKKIGCVQHDCNECKTREDVAVSMEPVSYRFCVGYEWFMGSTFKGCKRILHQSGLNADIEPLYSATQLASVQAELAKVKQERDELLELAKYVLEDDGYIPRATSTCRASIREAIAKYEVK